MVTLDVLAREGLLDEFEAGLQSFFRGVPRDSTTQGLQTIQTAIQTGGLVSFNTLRACSDLQREGMVRPGLYKWINDFASGRVQEALAVATLESGVYSEDRSLVEVQSQSNSPAVVEVVKPTGRRGRPRKPRKRGPRHLKKWGFQFPPPPDAFGREGSARRAVHQYLVQAPAPVSVPEIARDLGLSRKVVGQQLRPYLDGEWRKFGFTLSVEEDGLYRLEVLPLDQVREEYPTEFGDEVYE